MSWVSGAGGARRPPRWSALLLLGGLLLLILAVSTGSVPVPLRTTISALWDGLLGRQLTPLQTIAWQLRLPRVLMGLLVGGGLGLSGAAFQGLFRNPLADPYLMGVASGSALGATAAVVLGISFLLIPLWAFLGGLLAVLTAILLVQRSGQLPTSSLVLAGVVVGSVLTSMSTYLLISQHGQTRTILSVTMGNLAYSDWAQLRSLLPYALPGGLVLLAMARPLNQLQLGEVTAHSLGVPVERLKWVLVLAATLVTAAAVSYAGIIGFVGLVTPHLLRRLIGADHRLLLPWSALGGGLLLVAADLVSRTVVRPSELPVGIVTTLLGGPFFLYLLRRSR